MKADDNEEEWANKRHKIIQDFKRRMLNNELGQYETEIQQYEYLYEQELTAFESETYKINSPYQMCRLNMSNVPIEHVHVLCENLPIPLYK